MAEPHPSRFAGRVALVTGGLRDIGLGVAERLLADGATVVVADLKPSDDAETLDVMKKLGSQAQYLRLDVAREEDWQAALASIGERQGRLDILVNNAGTDCVGAVETIELAAWRRVMSINLDGVFLGTKTFTALMAQSGKGRRAGASIINISSILGLVGFAEASAYSATKGAVRLFTKSVAIEFAQKRTPIRVNSVHPGFVRTPLLQSGMQRWADEGKAKNAQDLLDALGQQTPIGRIAEPDEIAAVVAFLASDDSSYVTGAELVVDGGWTAQ